MPRNETESLRSFAVGSSETRWFLGCWDAGRIECSADDFAEILISSHTTDSLATGETVTVESSGIDQLVTRAPVMMSPAASDRHLSKFEKTSDNAAYNGFGSNFIVVRRFACPPIGGHRVCVKWNMFRQRKQNLRKAEGMTQCLLPLSTPLVMAVFGPVVAISISAHAQHTSSEETDRQTNGRTEDNRP